jgi:HK97 gp10 family phage protein
MATTRDEVVSGGRELDDLLQTLPVKMEKNINRSGLQAGAKVFLDAVKQRIPVDKGDLRKTARISSRAKGGQVSASVKVGGKYKGVDAYYAKFVEFGTRPHLVKVDPRDRGTNRRTGRDISLTTINRQQRVLGSLNIGGSFVGPSVMHSGARPKPFMRPAVDAAFPEAIQAVTKKIRERLSKQGLNTQAPNLPGVDNE